MEVAALVVGLVGLILSLNIFTSLTGLILGILAVIFGIIGIVKKGPDKGKATAGLVLGIVTIVIIAIISIVASKFIAGALDQLPKLIEEISESFEVEMENFMNTLKDELAEVQRESMRNLF